MSNPFTYSFYYDDANGTLRQSHLTLEQFKQDKYLFGEYDYDEQVHLKGAFAKGNDSRFQLFLGRSAYSLSWQYLRQDKTLAEELGQLAELRELNPLRYYAPNSQEQLDFINDDEATVCAMVDLNRSGKTTAMWVKMLVGNPPMIECDPQWELFTKHGVKFREWRGSAISVGVATYNAAKLADPIWKEIIKKWTPDRELGVYGRRYRGKKGKYEPSWGYDKHTRLAKSGSLVGYYTYEMDQGNFEGGALQKWGWDEQGERAKWDGADRGTRTTGGCHYFSLTPHMVEGRPDTGANGWLYPFLTGKKTMGHLVRTYTGGAIDDIPEWIYSERDKEMEKEKWDREPRRTGDKRRVDEGRARLKGEWHAAGGRVFGEWDAEASWIDPLWDVDKAPPHNLTLYRSMDHGQGQNAPTVCLCWAVDPDMNVYIYRGFYSYGHTISEDVVKVIEMCGNRRKRVDEWVNPANGMIVPMYEEVPVREAFECDAMDSRSFSFPDKLTGKPYGWLYKQSGLTRIVKASGKHYEHWVPMINGMLMAAKTKNVDAGTPRLYVFNTPSLTPLKAEIESWSCEVPTGKRAAGSDLPPRPQEKNNHGPTAMGYGVQIPLRYLGSYTRHIIKARERSEECVILDGKRTVDDGRVLGYRGV